MRSDKFGSQLDRKSKTWFFTLLNVYVSWIEREKILISQLSLQKNSGILKTRMDQRGDPMKTDFDIFQIQKLISQTTRAQKVEEINWVICLIFMSPSWVIALKLAKIVHFLQICADLCKKPRSIKVIYLYIFILVCFIGVWATVHEILRNKIQKSAHSAES